MLWNFDTWLNNGRLAADPSGISTVCLHTGQSIFDVWGSIAPAVSTSCCKHCSQKTCKHVSCLDFLPSNSSQQILQENTCHSFVYTCCHLSSEISSIYYTVEIKENFAILCLCIVKIYINTWNKWFISNAYFNTISNWKRFLFFLFLFLHKRLVIATINAAQNIIKVSVYNNWKCFTLRNKFTPG